MEKHSSLPKQEQGRGSGEGSRGAWETCQEGKTSRLPTDRQGQSETAEQALSAVSQAPHLSASRNFTKILAVVIFSRDIFTETQVIIFSSFSFSIFAKSAINM